ncbi:YobA family protein [Paenibacillus sp. An7]|uniref:YobA family protein n=1 Tax=Paenibacillus sp. An7 TaxID=2689577 RepID=UPI0013573933|nr:YobA family protein [Paenibacillus sp. An7]
MKKFVVTFLLVPLLLSGCSLNEESSSEYRPDSTNEEATNPTNATIITGYIIDKEKERLLVVEGLDESEFDITQQTVEEILTIADPNATWVSIGDNEYKDFSIGEQVKITVDGGVNTSFPAQASAEKIEKVK